jgi:hypothetical protein
MYGSKMKNRVDAYGFLFVGQISAIKIVTETTKRM